MRAHSTPARYRFKPLGENGIRLLKIQPELKNGRIACILNQCENQIPQYNALSYFWGDATLTRTIYIDGIPVNIHESLWEFLDQMRGSQQTEHWIQADENWIWTDFLCLDQSNFEEMGQQIPRMGKIYSEAERTIAWLGCRNSPWIAPPTGSPKLPIDLEDDLRSVAKMVAVKGTAVKWFFAQRKLVDWTHVTNTSLGELRELRVLRSSEPDRIKNRLDLPQRKVEVEQLRIGTEQPIINAISLPYWTRAWITQEVALAKEVMLMFGGVSINFNDFILAYKSYAYRMMRSENTSEIKRRLRVPIQAREAVRENKVSFQQIVQWGQNCNATKPIDRIYGLLGLLGRCGDGADTLPSTLTRTIDYTKDLRDLYWDIALTYRPITDPSTVKEGYLKIIQGWVDLLPGLAKSLSCPFTPESLRYADNDGATPLCRSKARLAIRVVDTITQLSMRDRGISVEVASASQEPTKRYVHKLWFTSLGSHWLSIQGILAGLLIEHADSQEIDEHDEYQAVKTGLAVVETRRWEGGWNCVPHRSFEGPPEQKNNVSFACEIEQDLWQPSSQPSSQLPCSSLLAASNTLPSQKSHQCQTSDRFCFIQGTGWRLSLKNLHYSGRRWEGILNVEY